MPMGVLQKEKCFLLRVFKCYRQYLLRTRSLTHSYAMCSLYIVLNPGGVDGNAGHFPTGIFYGRLAQRLPCFIKGDVIYGIEQIDTVMIRV